MTTYDWRCFVCDAANRAADSACHQCGAPDQIKAQEIATRRLQWKGVVSRPAWGQDLKWGLAGKLALLLGANVLLSIGLMALALSGGGNPLGVVMLGRMLLFPAPFLLLAWIVAVVHFWWKRIKNNVTQSLHST